MRADSAAALSATTALTSTKIYIFSVFYIQSISIMQHRKRKCTCGVLEYMQIMVNIVLTNVTFVIGYACSIY